MALLTATHRTRVNRGSHRWLRLLPGLIAALFLMGPAARAQPGPLREYQVKAVFLFNFSQFVEWPATAFPDAQAPFVIGVLGEDPFGAYLDETVLGEKAAGHSVVVRRFRRVEDVDTCHILFVARSESGRLTQILAGLRGRSVLTVGDMDSFTEHGGIIRFITENSRVRMRINLEAAKAVKLTISSKVLRPAEIVGRTEE